MATNAIDAHVASPSANHDAAPAGSLTKQDKTQECMTCLDNITKRSFINRSISAMQ